MSAWSEATAMDDDRVAKAARWLATTPYDRRPRPLVPHLAEQFGLTPVEACEAIREANLIAARAL